MGSYARSSQEDNKIEANDADFFAASHGTLSLPNSIAVGESGRYTYKQTIIDNSDFGLGAQDAISSILGFATNTVGQAFDIGSASMENLMNITDMLQADRETMYGDVQGQIANEQIPGTSVLPIWAKYIGGGILIYMIARRFLK